jgi:hypothetical protein
MIGKYIVGRFTKRLEAGAAVHLQKNIDTWLQKGLTPNSNCAFQNYIAGWNNRIKSNQFIYYIYIININSSFKYIKRKKNEMNRSFYKRRL